MTNRSKNLKEENELLNFPHKKLTHNASSSNINDIKVIQTQNNDSKTQTSTVGGQNSYHNSPILKVLDFIEEKEMTICPIPEFTSENNQTKPIANVFSSAKKNKTNFCQALYRRAPKASGLPSLPF